MTKKVKMCYPQIHFFDTKPNNNKKYTLVIVYVLSEQHPMNLLTYIESVKKEDTIKIIRLYLLRWKIGKNFRGGKLEYDFENIRFKH